MSCGSSCFRDDVAKKLTPEQYHITQEAGTEQPFTGDLLENKEEGTYLCVVCNVPLFSSETKYNSGTGWPSFYKTIPVEEEEEAKETVERKPDNSIEGRPRVEVTCRKCQAHLGHVFQDGPQPTGERFCINSVALQFAAAKKADESEEDQKE